MIRLRATTETRREIEDHARRMVRLSRIPEADLEPVQATIRAGFAANFAAEQAGDGDPWAPLAPSTVAERRRLGYPGEHPILVRSGDYRRSLIDPGHSDHISEIENVDGVTRVREGSQDPRIEWLEYGTGRIPPRPALEMGDPARAAIGREIDRVLDRLLQVTDNAR